MTRTKPRNFQDTTPMPPASCVWGTPPANAPAAVETSSEEIVVATNRGWRHTLLVGSTKDSGH